MLETHSGTCFCGAVAIEVKGNPLEMGYCHCASCRSYSGAPVKAFTLWRDENVSIVRGGELLGSFKKSAMSERRFCTRCGGHVMVSHPALGCTDIHAAMFASLTFKPSVHLNYIETVMPICDGLPKLRDFPAHAGGSGETVAETACDILT
jgi:hypothetical protein